MFSIELAHPLKHFFVLFVAGIANDFEILIVSMNSTNILRWASSFALNTDWIFLSLDCSQTSFKKNFVLSIVTEVVFVFERKSFADILSRSQRNTTTC
jgi:hypothetical protein